MHFKNNYGLFLCYLLGIISFYIVSIPGNKKVTSSIPFLCVIVLIILIYTISYILKKEKRKSLTDITCIILIFLGTWDVLVTKLNIMHPVLFPAPEDVFYVFYSQYDIIIKNVVSSLSLLFISVFIGLFLGTVFGLFCGWIPRLRGIFYPIASVIAPIPAIVYAPYIIALMPNFRSASAVIVVLGIFFPCFLNNIIRVESFDKSLLDVTKVMKLDNFTMIFSILLPYIFPGIVSGLKVTLTTAFTMLTFAEMMGATSGMGYYIVNYNTFGNYTNVLAGIITTGGVVLMLNKLVVLIQKKTIKWS